MVMFSLSRSIRAYAFMVYAYSHNQFYIHHIRLDYLFRLGRHFLLDAFVDRFYSNIRRHVFTFNPPLLLVPQVTCHSLQGC